MHWPCGLGHMLAVWPSDDAHACRDAWIAGVSVLATWGREGEMVVDMYAGTGTTGLACLRSKRFRFTGTSYARTSWCRRSDVRHVTACPLPLSVGVGGSPLVGVDIQESMCKAMEGALSPLAGPIQEDVYTTLGTRANELVQGLKEKEEAGM